MSAPVTGSILIVDDETFLRSALDLYFQTLGFRVATAEDGEKAPGISGIDVLKGLKARDPTVEVIITTACGSMGTAIEALRNGAFDYITKPIVNFDEDILKVVQEALKARLEKEARPAPGAGGAGEEAVVLHRLVELAREVNGYSPGDSVLETLEEMLSAGFGIRAGLVLHGRSSGRFAPVYSWGFPAPIAPGDGFRLESELLADLGKKGIRFLPASCLEPASYGIAPEDLAGFEKVAFLPLSVQGNIWGVLIAFLAEDLPGHAPVEDHPFHVLVPILSYVLPGALRPRNGS